MVPILHWSKTGRCVIPRVGIQLGEESRCGHSDRAVNRASAASSSGSSGRVRRNAPSSVARNSAALVRTRRSVPPLQVMHRQLVVRAGRSGDPGSGRAAMRPVTKCEAGWVETYQLRDLVIGQVLLLQVEPVERLPGPADAWPAARTRRPPGPGGTARGAWLARRPARAAAAPVEGLPAEADVGEVGLAAELDAQQHVGAGR